MKHATLINILLDNSRFMQQYVIVDTERMLNQFITEQRQIQSGEIAVSFSTFADEYQPAFVDRPINEVEPFIITPDGQ